MPALPEWKQISLFSSGLSRERAHRLLEEKKHTHAHNRSSGNEREATDRNRQREQVCQREGEKGLLGKRPEM